MMVLSGSMPISGRDLKTERIFTEQRSRLANFIRRRVSDPGDAEDLLQDVFSALVEANLLLVPIEHITGWLYRAARNRITDFFRKQRPLTIPSATRIDDEGESLPWEELLPSPDAGPDALYARRVLLDHIEEAIAELPPEQRSVFLAHEIVGRSFKEISAETGVGVNTLLARKRYAVLHLRRRLQDVYEEFVES